MKRFKFVLIILSLLIILLIGLFSFSKPKKILIAEYNPHYLSIYPKINFIKFENKDFLITEIYKYRINLLTEIQFSGGEGFATQKVDISDFIKTKEKAGFPKFSKSKRKTTRLFKTPKFIQLQSNVKTVFFQKLMKIK